LFVTRDIWIEKSKNFGSHSESIEKLYDDVFSKEVDIVRSVQDWPTEKSKEILQFHGDEIHCFEESGNYHSLKWVDAALRYNRKMGSQNGIEITQWVSEG
jgi:hypothetical protein